MNNNIHDLYDQVFVNIVNNFTFYDSEIKTLYDIWEKGIYNMHQFSFICTKFFHQMSFPYNPANSLLDYEKYRGTHAITYGPPSWSNILKWVLYTLPDFQSNYWKKQSFLFMHIPKTAGCSIINQLPECYHHGHVFGKIYPIHVRCKLKTIVRNPYDRLVSAYFFIKKGGFNNNLIYFDIVQQYSTFEQWILNDPRFNINHDNEGFLYYNTKYLDMEPTFLQTEWLLDNNDQLIIPIENIGYFENLEIDVQRLFGIQLNVKLNQSEHMDWRSYYTNPLVKEKVYNLYKKDFEILHYDKDF